MTSAEGMMALTDPLLGQVIQERYRVCRVIGKGGMGVVYEAQHLLTGRKVAVKTLAAHAALSAACVQRFQREAQAAASVGNSHVVDVLDMGRLDSGSFYIVMEHLDGADLSLAVARERRFSVPRAVHVLSQLCDALSAVHDAGIVHRDLKPENIFLIVRDGKADFVKVLDFGVCKFEEEGAQRLTASGDAVGTPLFMAPEQVEGRRDVDHRVDVYALGAILYFMLTGQAPFTAATLPRLFVRICNDSPASLQSHRPDLPVELDEIVQRALSKLPALRFGNCAELKTALLGLAVESLVPLSPPSSGVIPSASRDTESPTDTASLARRLKLDRAGAWGAALLGVGTLLGAVAATKQFVKASHIEPSLHIAAARPSPAAAPVEQALSDGAFSTPAASSAVVLSATAAKPPTPGAMKPSRRLRVSSAAVSASARSSSPPVAQEPPGDSAARGGVPDEAPSRAPAEPEVESSIHLNRGPKRGL